MNSKKRHIHLMDAQPVVDNLPTGLIWIDEQGKILLINKKLSEDLNRVEETLEELSIFDICPSYNKKNWQGEWKSFQMKKINLRHTELMTELGFFFPVQILFNYIQQDGQNILFGIVQNLLDTNKEKLQTNIDSAYHRIGRWELDVLKEQTFFTSNCYEVLGLDDEEDAPLSFGDHETFFGKVFNKEQLYKLQAMLNSSFDTQLPTELELCLELPSTKKRWIHFRIQPISVEDIVVKIVGSMQDISQFKKKDEALKEAFAKIEQLNKNLKIENIYLKKELENAEGFEDIITKGANYRKVLQHINEVAPTDATVLITGETGTGKELLARAIHRLSKRQNRTLVNINCAVIPENLLESELFGHERGAFTGAVSKKIGRFEIADKGTIFLDEIGELPLLLQAKLLRVLQEGEITRIGSNRTITLDVRVIAATNKKLERLIEKGSFREDLYYRLNVYPIENIPLRQRREDIPLLISYFAKKYSKKIGKDIDAISQLTIDRLMEYSFPGNVRELQNIVERAVIQNKGSVLKLTSNILDKSKLRSNEDILKTFEEMQRDYILKVLKHTRWKVSGENGASQILGMNSNTLESKMRKLGIRRKDFMS